MSSRIIYAIIGLFIGAGVDLLINLLAAAIQQQSFDNQFNQHSLWWLGGLAVAGLLLGYWLGIKLQLELPQPALTPAQPASAGKPTKTLTITRLQALLSYAKLRGHGIHLTDILLIGARIDIDTED